MSVIEKLQKLSSVEELKDSIFRLHRHKLELPSQKPIYIFGAKNLGQKALKACQELKWDIKGFVDNDLQLQHQKLDGFPVYTLEELDKTVQPVIIIASLLYYFEIKQQLAIAGFINCIDYNLLALYYKEFETHPCYVNVLEDLVQNKNEYIKFREILYDEKSKQTFDNLIMYRLSFDDSYLSKSFSGDQSQEYFEDSFMSFSENEVFIDGGAYDGETSRIFIEKVNHKYKKIYVFEPDHNNYLTAKENLKHFPNIEIFPKGLYSQTETLKFHADNTQGSKISNQGDTIIEVVSLDECIHEPITYIKLDIEGAEYAALCGAKEHLQKDCPKLAICLYHSPEDFWKIPALLSDVLLAERERVSILPATLLSSKHGNSIICDSLTGSGKIYQFHLRHYSLTIADTILYAIPEK